jgi:hypothetical protein
MNRAIMIGIVGLTALAFATQSALAVPISPRQTKGLCRGKGDVAGPRHVAVRAARRRSWER